MIEIGLNWINWLPAFVSFLLQAVSNMLCCHGVHHRVLKELGCSDGVLDEAAPDMLPNQGMEESVLSILEYRRLLRQHRKHRELHQVRYIHYCMWLVKTIFNIFLLPCLRQCVTAGIVLASPLPSPLPLPPPVCAGYACVCVHVCTRVMYVCVCVCVCVWCVLAN